MDHHGQRPALVVTHRHGAGNACPAPGRNYAAWSWMRDAAAIAGQSEGKPRSGRLGPNHAGGLC